MAVSRLILWLIGALLALPTAAMAQTGPVQLRDPTAAPETVWSHDQSACSDTDYSDVPVRPFYGHMRGGSGWRLFWFASNATGYLATEGVVSASDSDILAKMARVKAADGRCITWVKAGPYSEPPSMGRKAQPRKNAR